MRRCRLHRHAAASWAGRSRPLLCQWLGQNPARGRRFLRSPLRHETCGPGPSSRRAEDASDAEKPPREPLTGRQEFTVLYAFNDDYLEYAANQVVSEAAAYAKRIGASNVKVSGYRATTVLSNGDHLVEK